MIKLELKKPNIKILHLSLPLTQFTINILCNYSILIAKNLCFSTDQVTNHTLKKGDTYHPKGPLSCPSIFQNMTPNKKKIKH